jgi:hypothetical protein
MVGMAVVYQEEQVGHSSSGRVRSRALSTDIGDRGLIAVSQSACEGTALP